MDPKHRISALIRRFKANREDYQDPNYKETRVRGEFIDPLLEALGWDVHNAKNVSAAFRDVVPADALTVSGETKEPDYAFRVGGVRKFFLEAKKPSLNLHSDRAAAYQLRRYGWSAKLPVSILTDFEELAVYDCRFKPEPSESAATARLIYMTFSEYLDRWDELASIFSREAVASGAFDAFSRKTRRKKGTQEIDDDFLQQIEAWRHHLAKDIWRRNPGLKIVELNTAVQRTIDRLVFLRIAEDRGIERYGRLREAAASRAVYDQVKLLFREADKRYNSGLFHFDHKDGLKETLDEFTLDLVIGTPVIREVINELYYPVSPYAFSVIPADILGQVYERFLGHVVEIVGNEVEVTAKPAVKKAGGVFYTPTFVVQYIVEKTLGPLLDGRTWKQVSGLDKRSSDPHPVRVVDPACGSGSFLIEAYQYLIHWYLHKYTENDADRFAQGKEPAIYKTHSGEWRLTVSERRRILVTHIFGVDIDPQAVEVTKLSLLLKVLEGERSDEIAKQLDWLKSRALPDLGGNIKCGNALIDSSFYSQFDFAGMSPTERQRVNVLDWIDEFPFLKRDKGFEVVMGNPPYGALLSGAEKQYFAEKYVNQSYQADTYLLFVERAVRDILRPGGQLGMIIPNPWLTNIQQSALRRFIMQKTSIREIVHFLFPVFAKAKATVDTEILILSAGLQADNIVEARFVECISPAGRIESFTKEISHQQDAWRSQPGETINIFLDPQRLELATSIRKSNGRLDSLFKINVGIKPYQTGKGLPRQTPEIVKERPFDAKFAVDQSYRRYLRGSDIRRFCIAPLEDRFISYGPWLAEPRPAANFDAPRKILVRQTGDSLVAALDESRHLCLNNLHVLVPYDDSEDLDYIVGLINSRVLNWFYRSVNPEMGEALAEVKKHNVAQLPVPASSNANASLRGAIAEDSRLVRETALQIAEKRHTEHTRTTMRRTISAAYRRMQSRIYALYGLAESEVAIIEQDEAKTLAIH